MSPTVCKNNHETEKEARAQEGAVEPLKKKKKKISQVTVKLLPLKKLIISILGSQFALILRFLGLTRK
jgi:hypothetical protein